jgi:hypothetical protein
VLEPILEQLVRIRVDHGVRQSLNDIRNLVVESCRVLVRLDSIVLGEIDDGHNRQRGVTLVFIVHRGRAHGLFEYTVCVRHLGVRQRSEVVAGCGSKENLSKLITFKQVRVEESASLFQRAKFGFERPALEYAR